MASGYVSPTGFNDPNSSWTYESQAYDGIVETSNGAYTTISGGSWSNFIELTIGAINCSKIKYYLEDSGGGDISEVDVDVYYSGAWNNIYSGAFTRYTWIEKELGAIYSVTAMRFRFYNSTGGEIGSHLLMEAMFYHVIVAPTVTTQAVTDITHNSATGNGEITDTGDENCTKRGVCYNTTGSPTTADDKVEEEGDFGIGAFTAAMTGLSPGVKYYVKAYAINSEGTGYGAEVNFTTDKVAPTVTTQSPTDVLPTTVTGNGNITALGGENATVRGFKYGLTKVDTWDAHDDGSFSAGAFTKGLTGLSANTTYWIRAYATNSIGTSYGDWVEFQTAAQGTIPTGTKIDICSDYSGYTYQSQRSETDDGSAYTAYFVISTDLTDKRGLAFYKRILDLHLYFNSESSGTATVEVKRDHEATWQSVGSVALTGTADIIVKHLAVRIYGKHFLFKISASNHFEFLGCLFQFLRRGMR